MKIGIDARLIHWAGIGRYIKELIFHLAQIDKTNRYVIYFSDESQRESSRLDYPNFQLVTLPCRIFSIYEQFYLPYRILRDGLDLFHSPHYVVPVASPRPIVATIHDTIYLTYPQFLKNPVARFYYRIMHGSVMRRAARLIAVSAFTKAEIEKHYPGAGAKARVVYNGLNAALFLPPAESRGKEVGEKRSLPDHYLLYVGTLKHHKNIETLLRAYACLGRNFKKKYHLVLVCGDDHRVQELGGLAAELKIDDKVHFAGYMQEEELHETYRGADLYVCLSFYEGFCFPVLEAMACKVPVVASQQEAIAEVTGGAALLVEAGNAAEAAKAIERILQDSGLRQDLIRRGIERTGGFSWKKCAQENLEVYREVYAVHA